jgi:hypothetical protein
MISDTSTLLYSIGNIIHPGHDLGVPTDHFLENPGKLAARPAYGDLTINLERSTLAVLRVCAGRLSIQNPTCVRKILMTDL